MWLGGVRSADHRPSIVRRRLLTRLQKKQGVEPKRLVTDKLGSYVAARQEIMPNTTMSRRPICLAKTPHLSMI